MSAASLFIAGLLVLGGLLVAATPWVIVIDCVIETRRGSRETSGIAVGVAGLMCIFEVVMLIDVWRLGLDAALARF